MKPLNIVATTLLSCILFSFLFIYVLHKPLTVQLLQEQYQHKLAYLKGINGNKIVILAGSNGRFSHRCETIEQEIKFPCANMSIMAGMSLGYQLEKIKPYLYSKDILYLPLEYGKLNEAKNIALSGAEIPYVMTYDHAYLYELDWDAFLYAIFYFDIKYFISSVGEITFNKMGLKKRYSTDTLTPQGDESKHTIEKAEQYKTYIDKLKWTPPTPATVNRLSYSAESTINFMRWATNNGITVIGGLPTVFDDSQIPDETISTLRDFYTENGHQFISLKNKCQYPREYFYDTSYHLSEKYQILHSKSIAQKISTEIVNI